MTPSQDQAVTCTHPMSELLVPLSQGQLDADDAGRVLDHVEQCPICSRQLDFLADLVTAVSSDAAPSSTEGTVVRGEGTSVRSAPLAERAEPKGKLLRFPLAWAGGLAAAAAILLLVVPMFLGEPASVAGFADTTRPIYSGVRGVDTFDQAMGAYNEGDLATAVTLLTEHIDAGTEEDAAALFYRGVARLELDQLEGARQDLQAAATLADGQLGDAARWYLAQVHLRLEHAPEALSLLDALGFGDGAYRDAAAELAEEVRTATAR